MNETLFTTIVTLGILVAIVVLIGGGSNLLSAIKRTPGTTYGQRLRNEIAYDLETAKNGFKILFQTFVGLAAIGVLVWGLYGLWSKFNEEWVCYQKDGGIVYTKGKPDSGWVKGKDGILYPKDAFEGCAKN